jgi:hypothetical protein
MVSHKKFGDIELTLGEAGIRFKRKPSAYNRYIAKETKGKARLSKEEFLQLAKSYKNPVAIEIKDELELNSKINKSIDVLNSWDIEIRKLENAPVKEDIFKLKKDTVDRLKYVIC